MDCRDTDEVSVLLPLSKMAGVELGGFEEGAFWGGGPELRGLLIPCISRFLKPSTFKDCRLTPGAGLSVAVRSFGCPAISPPFSCGSMVASVRENGFAGAPLGECPDAEGSKFFHVLPSISRSFGSLPVGSCGYRSSKLSVKAGDGSGAGEPARRPRVNKSPYGSSFTSGKAG